MVSRFLGRDIIQEPSCPFCGMAVDRPTELERGLPGEMPVGRCSCGAVYACDVTGHNLGSAMVEALVLGCEGDWDLAWSLLPEKDYLEKQVKRYDYESHLVIPAGVHEGRRIAGVLYFIRLQKDAGDGGAQEILKGATPPSRKTSGKTTLGKSLTKREVEALVNEYDLEALLHLAETDGKIMRHLKRLLYSADVLVRWRAADIMGRVSAIIAREDPGTIARLLQGLFTSVVDTAASSWGSLDAIGEIISNRPDQFAGYVPQLFPLARDRALLAEVLRALGRIGEKKPDLIRSMANQFIPLLQDPAPEIRGYAALLLGNLGAREAKENLTALAKDPAGMEVYREGRLEKRTIGQLAEEALRKL